MQEGGSLVWESDADGEHAWENLPLWARKQIIEKNIRVFTLPGFDIARKATDRADLQLRMQGNAFLGAFFAVSPMLQEFGISQEQFRDVVHKQYVKKFGKLGDAVVQSNMEVMLQGFERVKEIKIGEMTAPDHSSLRGQALLPILTDLEVPEFAEAGCSTGGSCGTGRRSTPKPAGAGPAGADRVDRGIRCGVPVALRLQPAGHAALGHGRDCRGYRRHGFEVRGPPRDAALHSGELHAVHGVHFGLPGYGAAQLLAGPEHAA